MRIYDPADEERIRSARHVADWTRSGLLAADQGRVLAAELTTPLRRTNLALRIIIFGFTLMLASTEGSLWFIMLGTASESGMAVAAILLGVVNAVVAELLVRRFRLYRHGVEEACVIMAGALIAGGSFWLLLSESPQAPAWIALVVGAAAAGSIYLRYGYLYAVLIGCVCVAGLPLAWSLPLVLERMYGAVFSLLIFALAGGIRRTTDDDLRRDQFAVVEAVAWGGIYAYLHLSWGAAGGRGSGTPSIVYWSTYAAIWLLPAIGLAAGVVARSRDMIRVNLILFIVTLSTHKLYLQWPSHEWDPILLGLLLVAVAVSCRRWLAAGANGHRGGFTADPILASEQAQRSMVSMVGGFKEHGPAQPRTGPSSSFEPGGGASGGAGASGSF